MWRGKTRHLDWQLGKIEVREGWLFDGGNLREMNRITAEREALAATVLGCNISRCFAEFAFHQPL